MVQIIIRTLDEGYLITNDAGQETAVCNGQQLVRKVREYFGLVKTGLEKNFKKSKITLSAEIFKDTKAESHNSQSLSIEHEPPRLLQVESSQEATLSKLDTNDIFIFPNNLKISAFEYDKTQMEQYKTILFQELPDGRVVLDYNGSRYYTMKEWVLQIPFPFPRKCFSKETGWSSSTAFAFKSYRKYLDEQEEIKLDKSMGLINEFKKEKKEDPDDWKYKPFGINKTRVEKEDYTKIEGDLNG